jgi:hypothetical protein
LVAAVFFTASALGAAAFLAGVFFSVVALAAVFFAVAIIFSFVDLHKTSGSLQCRTIQSDVELRIARNTNLLHAKISVFCSNEVKQVMTRIVPA